MRFPPIILAATLLAQACACQPDSSSIFALNPRETVGNAIIQAHRKYSNWDDTSLIPPVVSLAVITDIHGDGDSFSRYLAYCKKYSQWIDGQIQLGDIVSDQFSDEIKFYKTKKAENVMMVLGNHDSHLRDGEPDTWRAAGNRASYDRYFAPNIDKWGVVQPEGAAQNAYMFYYKDYPASKLRLVVLDCMFGFESQQKWFEQVLQQSLEDGYAVVAAQHIPTGEVIPEGPFNSKDYPMYMGGFNSPTEPLLFAIDNFIENGGEFVCWMHGDAHFDGAGRIKAHPKQLELTFENAGVYDYWNDSYRLRGEKCQDSFNIVAIDTYDKLVKVVRVGNNIDRHLQYKDTWEYRYK